jgi:hypothetical protein
VACDSLGGFKGAVIFQKIRDAGRTSFKHVRGVGAGVELI